jgi:hypothetical protein
MFVTYSAKIKPHSALTQIKEQKMFISIGNRTQRLRPLFALSLGIASSFASRSGTETETPVTVGLQTKQYLSIRDKTEYRSSHPEISALPKIVSARGVNQN